jgi:hypothetical protein
VRSGDPNGDLREYRIGHTVDWDANGCLRVTDGSEQFMYTVACCHNNCASPGTGTGTGEIQTGTSGGPGGGGGGVGDFSPDCGRDINATLYASLPFGDGTMTLTWDGSTYWTGNKLLGCGKTLYLRFSIVSQNRLEWSCNGTNFIQTDRPTNTCTPFSPTDYSMVLTDVSVGCGAPCAGIYSPVTVSE